VNASTLSRQGRGVCQPGATPREHVRGTSSALQGRRIPAPLQGAPLDSETQGVALGWHPAAPSAPEPKLDIPEFRRFDGWSFMRGLLAHISHEDVMNLSLLVTVRAILSSFAKTRVLVAQTSVCAPLVWVFCLRETQIKIAQTEVCATRPRSHSLCLHALKRSISSNRFLVRNAG
jgi:hypothetical protein